MGVMNAHTRDSTQPAKHLIENENQSQLVSPLTLQRRSQVLRDPASQGGALHTGRRMLKKSF